MATTDVLVTAGDGCAGTPHTRAYMEIEPADPSPPVTDRRPLLPAGRTTGANQPTHGAAGS